MQDVLGELLKEIDYLDPYLRQFLKYLNGKDILVIGNNVDFLNNKLKAKGYNVENLEVLNSVNPSKYSGIILFNHLNKLDNNTIPNFLDDLSNSIQDNGLIFIVIRVNKDTKNYNKEYLDVVMEKNYNFIEELNSYENLKFYIYEKKHC